jgi:hypothetical protein
MPNLWLESLTSQLQLGADDTGEITPSRSIIRNKDGAFRV